MEQLFLLKLENGATLEVRAAAELGLARTDQCVFRKDFYLDLGEIVSDPRELPAGAEPPAVQRKATPRDLAMANENSARCRSALRTARSSVERLELPMKLLNAHYTMDGKLLTIQFTADGRVDFRELVKELSHLLSVRIELRQIGVRDETAQAGGIAVCGQELCCSRFLKEFSSINVRMAKDQDLSLTPATISGVCGRLKCCLKYEHEGYLELEKGMPRRVEYCDCPQGRGRISDRNLLTGEVSVQLEGGSVVRFPREEITVVKLERPPRRDNNGGNSRDKGADRNGSGRHGERRREEGKRRDARKPQAPAKPQPESTPEEPPRS